MNSPPKQRMKDQKNYALVSIDAQGEIEVYLPPDRVLRQLGKHQVLVNPTKRVVRAAQLHILCNPPVRVDNQSAAEYNSVN